MLQNDFEEFNRSCTENYFQVNHNKSFWASICLLTYLVYSAIKTLHGTDSIIKLGLYSVGQYHFNYITFYLPIIWVYNLKNLKFDLYLLFYKWIHTVKTDLPILYKTVNQRQYPLRILMISQYWPNDERSLFIILSTIYLSYFSRCW